MVCAALSSMCFLLQGLADPMKQPIDWISFPFILAKHFSMDARRDAPIGFTKTQSGYPEVPLMNMFEYSKSLARSS